MTPSEIVRAKNMDLILNQYNNEVTKINRDGFIDDKSKQVKSLKNRYDNILARFDTDKNTTEKKHIYKYRHNLDGDRIIGLKGIKPNIKVEGGK